MAIAVVNQFYMYCVDADFGPFFPKFSSYFPYTAKLRINGNERAKRQAVKARIGFTGLDNGSADCADPDRLQRICDRLRAAKIDALLRKWLRRLPHPFTAADRAAGYRYDISMLQTEFSLAQMLDRAAGYRADPARVGNQGEPIEAPQSIICHHALVPVMERLAAATTPVGEDVSRGPVAGLLRDRRPATAPTQNRP
ncbi:MAG: hypothetical protein ABI775_04730 [Pseudonocardiales bacterium]